MSKKIDKRKAYYAVIDTETAGKITFPLVYDLGVAISDKKGNIVATQNWIIEEIFYNTKLMTSAYYAEKLPQYHKMISNGLVRVVSFNQARYEMNKMLVDNNVKYLTAYNLAFDFRALKSTMKFLKTKSKFDFWEYCPFFYKKYQFIDIWSLACETILQQKNYKYFADEYNWKSPAGNTLSNAEKAYAYITGNREYEERHTALQDCFIELVILVKCLKQHKKFTKNKMVGNPWRLIQNKK